MDRKKRNSILRTASQDDDNTVDIARPKCFRFSGKKSIRTFSNEEETQIWQNSYELSDRADSTNNSNIKSGNSTDLHVPCTSTLCTTKEFIDKSNQGELVVEHSLDVTLLEYELQKLKHDCINPPNKMCHGTNLKQSTEKDIENKAQEMVCQKNEQPTSTVTTSTDVNFACIDENSNKENIAPEPYAMFDVHSDKKTTQKDETQTNMDFDSSGENCFKNSNETKFNKIHNNPATSTQHKISYTNEIDISEVLPNVSGVSPLATSSTSFTSCESPGDFYSSLIPPDLLPKCNKKPNLQQLNEDIAKGRLKIFPNIENKLKTKSPLITKKILKPRETEVKSYIVNTDSARERGKYTKIDLELSNTDYSKGAIPKTHEYNKERTIYEPNNIESTFFDCTEQEGPASKNRKTIYDDDIEIENLTIVKQQQNAFTINLHDEIEDRKIQNIEQSSATLHQQKGTFVMETSDIFKNISLDIRSPKDDYNIKNNRRTICYESDNIVTEESCQKNIEKTLKEKTNFNKEIDALQLSPKKSKFTFLQQTISADERDITSITDASEVHEQIQPKSKKYTHHFDESGITDITYKTNNVSDPAVNVQKEDSSLDQSECVIPETQLMEITAQEPLQLQINDKTKNRFTLYFNENEQINTTNQLNGTQSANSRNNVDESILKSGNENLIEKEQSSYNDFIQCNRKKSLKSDYFEFEESVKITKTTEKLNLKPQQDDMKCLNPKKKEFNFFDVDVIKKCTNNNSILENSQDPPMEVQIQSPLLEKTNEAKITKNRFTHIFNTTEPLNITCDGMKIQDVDEIPQTQLNDQRTLNAKNIPFLQNQNPPEAFMIEKRTSRKSLRFETKNQSNNGQKENNYFRNTKSLNSMNIRSQNNCTTDVENMRFERKTNLNKEKSFLTITGETGIGITPLRTPMRMNSNRRFTAMTPETPHRSIIEFERLERETMFSSQSDDSKTVTNQKRTTSNLTPNFPESKKRQPSMHSNFLFENLNNFSQTTGNKMNKLDHNNSELQYSSDNNMNSFDNQQEQDSSSNHNIQQCNQEPTTPLNMKMKKTRTPVYTGSATKKNIARISSPNMKSFLNCSLQTVDVGRFVANNETGKLLELDDMTISCESDVSKKSKKDKKSIFETDDKPITISDVSEHFRSLRQRQTLLDESISKKNKNKNEELMESLMEIIDSDDIDKTKLDLVETLLDETDEEELDELEGQENNFINVENIIQSLPNKSKEEQEQGVNVSAELQNNSTVPEIEIYKKRTSLLCQKCKNCQDTLLNETTYAENDDSFVMPKWPSIDDIREKFFSNMAKIRRGPTLQLAFEFSERMNLRSTLKAFESPIRSKEEEPVLEDIKDEDDPWIAEYKRKCTEMNKALNEDLSKPIVVTKPFVTRLRHVIKANAKDWILNTSRAHSQILSFRHKELYTFIITLLYKTVDPFGDNVIITNISFEDSTTPKRIWKPFDYMAHFQLQLELPYSLQSYCPGNSETDVCEMILKIGEICKTVYNWCSELWRIVNEEEARLIRINDQTLIKKILRKVIYNSNGLYQRTDKTEFRIEVTNIRKLCFKDIAMPALYTFREDIESLPAGLDFLNIFLKNPEKFQGNFDS